MNEETLEALKESIQHWENLLNGRDSSTGVTACALCRKFFFHEKKVLSFHEVVDCLLLHKAIFYRHKYLHYGFLIGWPFYLLLSHADQDHFREVLRATQGD